MPKKRDLPLEIHKADRFSLDDRLEFLEALKFEMWDRGLLGYLCKPGAQMDMYERAHAQPERFPGQAEPLVCLCHRQLGKTHLAEILLVEHALRNPGVTSNYGTDTVDRAIELWDEKLPTVIADMPPWINVWRKDRVIFVRNKSWPRGTFSKIRLRGLDHRKGDRLRGGNTGYWVIDEAGFVGYLEYAIRHVITPMFRGQKRPTFLIFTTPPENPQEHGFYQYYLRAQANDSLVEWPASKNPDWSADDDRMMLAEYGSKDDIGWKRELEVKMIADRRRIAVPEWGEADGKYYLEVVDFEADKVVDEGQVMRPEFYRGYVTIDAGWQDHTAAVLSAYDFPNRRLMALAEVFVHYTPIHTFARMLLEAIAATFPEELWKDLDIRTESDELVVQTLNEHLREEDRRFFVSAVDKWDPFGNLNNLRSGIALGRVVVNHDCVVLNQTLQFGMLNQKRNDFERSETFGHCDLLVAFNYQYKHVVWDENPWPKPEEKPRERRMVNPYTNQEERTKSLEAVAAIFDPKGLIRNGRLR